MMFKDFIKTLNKLFASVEFFNTQINKYKDVTKEPALPSYAYINWGLYLLECGSKDKGFDKLKQSVLINKSNPEAYINLGIAYAQDKNFEEALKNFKSAIRLDKNHARAWGYIAGVYSELGDEKLAQSAFDNSLKIDKTNPITYLNYAIFKMKNQKFDDAKDYFKKAYILNPSNTQPLMYWGIVLIEQQQYQQAFLKFLRIIQTEPFNFEALYFAGLTSFKMQKYKKTIEFCKKSLAFNHDKKECHMLIAQSLFQLGEKEACLKQYEDSFSLFQNDGKYFYNWGMALQKFELYKESVEKFEKCIELLPEFDEVFSVCAYSCIQLNQYNKAQALINRSIELNPGVATNYFNLANIYYKTENYIRAIDAYKKALAIDASLILAYPNIAQAYKLLGEIDKSIKYWNKAIEYDNTKPAYYSNLAAIYIDEKHDKNKAISYIRSAYMLDKKNPDIIEKYAIIMVKVGEYHQAEEKFSQALKLSPDSDRIKVGLCECYLKLNDIESAKRVLDTVSNEYRENQAYLYAKYILFVKMYQLNKTDELKDAIKQICDKIHIDFVE